MNNYSLVDPNWLGPTMYNVYSIVCIFKIKSYILQFQMVLVCEFCDSKFVKKRKLTIHAKKCMKSFRAKKCKQCCAHCKKEFSSLYSLKRHSKLV